MRHVDAGALQQAGLAVGRQLAQLVWGTDGRSVRDVFVAGRHVVADGRATAVDLDELRELATHRQARLLARAGLDVPHPWPHIDAR